MAVWPPKGGMNKKSWDELILACSTRGNGHESESKRVEAGTERVSEMAGQMASVPMKLVAKRALDNAVVGLNTSQTNSITAALRNKLTLIQAQRISLFSL